MNLEYGFVANVERPPGKNMRISVIINQINDAFWRAECGCFSNIDDLEIGPPITAKFPASNFDDANTKVVEWLQETLSNLLNCATDEILLGDIDWTQTYPHP